MTPKDLKGALKRQLNPKRAEWQKPAALVRVINETMTSGHIFIDAGNCVGWSLNNLVVGEKIAYHSALDMGPMGFGVCAVVLVLSSILVPTISGDALTGATKVLFGTLPAAAYTVQSNNTITATAPAAAGTVDVIVQNGGALVSRAC